MAFRAVSRRRVVSSSASRRRAERNHRTDAATLPQGKPAPTLHGLLLQTTKAKTPTSTVAPQDGYRRRPDTPTGKIRPRRIRSISDENPRSFSSSRKTKASFPPSKDHACPLREIARDRQDQSSSYLAAATRLPEAPRDDGVKNLAKPDLRVSGTDLRSSTCAAHAVSIRIGGNGMRISSLADVESTAIVTALPPSLARKVHEESESVGRDELTAMHVTRGRATLPGRGKIAAFDGGFTPQGGGLRGAGASTLGAFERPTRTGGDAAYANLTDASQQSSAKPLAFGSSIHAELEGLDRRRSCRRAKRSVCTSHYRHDRPLRVRRPCDDRMTMAAQSLKEHRRVRLTHVKIKLSGVCHAIQRGRDISACSTPLVRLLFYLDANENSLTSRVRNCGRVGGDSPFASSIGAYFRRAGRHRNIALAEDIAPFGGSARPAIIIDDPTRKYRSAAPHSMADMRDEPQKLQGIIKSIVTLVSSNRRRPTRRRYSTAKTFARRCPLQPVRVRRPRDRSLGETDITISAGGERRGTRGRTSTGMANVSPTHDGTSAVG